MAVTIRVVMIVVLMQIWPYHSQCKNLPVKLLEFYELSMWLQCLTNTTWPYVNPQDTHTRAHMHTHRQRQRLGERGERERTKNNNEILQFLDGNYIFNSFQVLLGQILNVSSFSLFLPTVLILKTMFSPH